MSEGSRDQRRIIYGMEIPTENYSDQPYIIKTDDGAWLCTVTTGPGIEGASGEHVVSLRSTDMGETWSKPVDIEPGDGPEASYAVLLKVPGGRVYCFYNHNTDNLREVKADYPPYTNGYCWRVDLLGSYVFKYSDDHGLSWSASRYPIPVREFEIDRENVYAGKIRFFWNVGIPFIHDDSAYISLHKIGGFGLGLITSNEGVLLKSANILTEMNPEKTTWETLPDGDTGLRTPPGGGPVAGEHSYCVLSDGSFYCVYRSVDGHPIFSYSRDGGHTWSESAYKRYDDERLMKHPRAANFAWKCENGKYLYWFHNHGGRFIRDMVDNAPYDDRNPVWLCGGVETDTPDGKIIRWSQPEIVLYDDDPYVRMSYPDLIEEDGRLFLTETQKDKARVHEISPGLLEGLWGQFDNVPAAAEGVILDLPADGDGGVVPDEIAMPALPSFTARDHAAANYGTKDLRNGFSLDMRLLFDSMEAGQIILDNRTDNGQGFCLRITSRGTVEIVLNDGRGVNCWDCDPGMLENGKQHHVVVIVDGGPRIISFVIDGKLCDGGDFRQFGWGRFNPNLMSVNGSNLLRIGSGLKGIVKNLKVYDRPLRTSEAIANFKHRRQG